ncbi:IS1595 family transposase [Endozoicomonas sp. SCSIO W0465]|uniref:IS1595 family transposase n=1 Tax=Endozoicomonas sp. SCSIO W0465 TaxID=2918516 RepID=UPI002074D274|nr:IS1595 family transposase [Endozoicomonas sp. SCSIO W0465]USE33729.1 IS1595 family transposase [Endozoicomonas sp. SCSIO W0465]USE34163.1 IS1595 family transposase [Endozoicomonas sp. SCSIO W0465]USE34207.1 IS1595 family transposase [Endozoicomonas sp. SCSIO W0465]USE34213.1 IS1595 family transposase [Endozoicomonas sp. SCSIO W0465]USE34361.1 IS1595 family transposase [Endozoicomonas sp. SCSIO W0465]
MCKNTIQFQKGLGIMQFLANYGSEEQCENALSSWRWPDGFQCPKCGSRSFCKLHRKAEFQCNCCRCQTSLTSNTIFDSTKLPLATWFLGIYLVTQNKAGISCLTLHRQLGISYNAALRMKHKLMQVMMERDNSWQLSGFVQIDDAYWGGERHGGRRGRGSENKAPFVAAVQTDADNHPIYMKFNAVDNFRRKTIQEWAEHALKKGVRAVSDGLSCFRGIEDAGCQHTAIITGGGHASMENELFTWVNTMLGNVKTAITGTYHKLDPKHLGRYLSEFNYRFNRRFDMPSMISRLGRAAVNTAPMPDRLLKLPDVQWKPG